MNTINTTAINPTIRRRRGLRRSLLAALAATAVVGASTPAAAGDGEDDRSGNEGSEAPEATVLTAAWFGGEGRPNGQVVERFAQEVERVSGGVLRIDVTYGVTDSFAAYERSEYDLLLAPTRSLDTMGVDTFVPLTLPFVVNDDEQADRVAQSDVVADMMEGLAAIDSTGLLVAPVYEVHLGLAEAKGPLTSLDQLQTGVRIDAPDAAMDGLYEALGATPTHDLNDEPWDAAIADGSVAAYEWPTVLTHGGTTMATNFALYYQFVVLMAHDEALAGLDEEQRAWIDDAASVAAQRSIDERLREDDAFRDSCAGGETLTAVPMSFIADVGRAVDDQIIEILDDVDLEIIYNSLRRATGPHTPSWPQECHNGEVSPYVPAPPPSSTFPEGAYRNPGRTRDQLFVSGATGDASANNTSEYIDFTIEDGTATFVFHRVGDPAEGSETCAVDYTVDAEGRITIPVGCGWEGTYTWFETPDGIGLELMQVDGVNVFAGFENSVIGLSAWVSLD